MVTKSLWTDRPDDWLSATDDAVATTPPQVPDPPPRAARPRRRPLVIAACALALAGVAGGGYEAGSDGDGDGDGDARPATAAALPAAGGRLAATEINAIYAKASKAVVSVQTSSGGGRGGSGTGFLIDRDGTVVTNAHVVDGASTVRVRFDDDAAPVAARVVGEDPSSDLAVLEVDAGAAQGVEPLAFADSSTVAVGDAAIAIGYPLGLDRTATAGIVSGLEREIEAPNGFSIDEVIQTDAPINPGNSGGPLLDAAGRVIGVNSQIATAGAGGGNVGIGFAVPSDTAREIVPKLKAGQSVERAWLGVSTAAAASGTGVEVGSVTAGGPAQRAGLRQGDRLVAIDGRRITEPDAVSDAVGERAPGETIEVEVSRQGSTRSLEITLGSRPQEATP